MQPPQYCAAGAQQALAPGATSASVCPGPRPALNALQYTRPYPSALRFFKHRPFFQAPQHRHPTAQHQSARPPSAGPGRADTITRPLPPADHPMPFLQQPLAQRHPARPRTRALSGQARGRAVHQAPGPSDYEPRGALALPAKPAHTLAGRHAPRVAEAAPGPGTYAPRGASRLVGAATSAPAFSMRSRPRDACATARPNMRRRALKVVAAALARS